MSAGSKTQATKEMKLEKLRSILRDMDGALLAFSGGVDSTFLLAVAADVLRDRLLAVTAVSETYTSEEHETAREIARSLGVRHTSISTSELEDRRFSSNPPERCYYCKKELFSKLARIADREKIGSVIDACNADDSSDYRPGIRGARETGARSPLMEVGLTKEEIRSLSREMGLPTWNKPAMACLASRFPYGETITAAKLARVDEAERFLRRSGFNHVRVRSHGTLARIEVEPGRTSELAGGELREKVVKKLKELGFVYVSLDMQGYRTGSLNEELQGK